MVTSTLSKQDKAAPLAVCILSLDQRVTAVWALPPRFEITQGSVLVETNVYMARPVLAPLVQLLSGRFLPWPRLFAVQVLEFTCQTCREV